MHPCPKANKKDDKENGKITIRHGELRKFGMLIMTVAPSIKDAGKMKQLKSGDKQ
ncbi:copper-binding protein [Herminiimonas sp. NPDC097707]|uniref:copper-binding protein n=1 Tax=Herminiimonas sp. NPDC097707 TaxID=3364007 RepID=UPI00383B6C39